MCIGSIAVDAPIFSTRYMNLTWNDYAIWYLQIKLHKRDSLVGTHSGESQVITLKYNAGVNGIVRHQV